MAGGRGDAMSRRLPGFSTDFHGTLRDCLSKAARREHAEVAGDGTKNYPPPLPVDMQDNNNIIFQSINFDRFHEIYLL